MNKNDLSPGEYNRLLDAIGPIIMEHGLKATTMDLVAARLGISKRTLYEIFDSKSQMTDEVLERLHCIHVKALREAFESSPTILEAWVKVLFVHRDVISNISANFFRDMDTHYKEVRGRYKYREDIRLREFEKMCQLGVEQGVFRPDVNYHILARVFEIQLESLKRMEEHFQADITPVEVYDTITLGFIRSIVTPEGLKTLETLTLPISDSKIISKSK